MDYHSALLLEHLLHALLLWGQLLLRLIRVKIEVVVVRCVPFVFLLWLDLLLDQLDQKCSQRVMIKMVQKTVEDFTLLVEKQIL